MMFPVSSRTLPALMLSTILVGCTHLEGVPKGAFIEVDGSLHHRTGASDWTFTTADGKQRLSLGQAEVNIGYDFGGCYVYAGLSHMSAPEYGYDRGLNARRVGTGCRYYFH